MNWRKASATALVVLFSNTLAAADCPDIDRANLRPNRSLLWLDNGKWAPSRTLSQKLGSGSKTIKFAYIVKDEALRNDRRGIVAIKSGFSRLQSSDDHDMDTVALYRPSMRDPCRKRPYPMMQGKVSVTEYDDYHDRDRRTDADKEFSKFHLTYDSQRGCRNSNDRSADAYFRQQCRSNRSQFSFDPDVVANGQYRQLFAWFRVRSAFARGSTAGRAVQIRKYQADKAGLACVTFRVTVGPGAFLRVNDLEGRTAIGGDAAVWSHTGYRDGTFPR
ncbi:hypothetical protein U8C37_25495 (plasmid) [Sinorhizobium medicae]|uniref:hypothetical protein n=1 Tax=Sinorhizobium medicae TaxID=110321 RepID=UPI002AF6A6F6|nr:hypothetical protein [Sinorhizobium medicae]WQO88062.1 hypothetical protein U8C37_25495 [Sinorhizobium medicae]